jgi:hypothetical protein
MGIRAMSARRERLLLVVTPLAAVVVVALGMQLGARSGPRRAAVVYAAPASAAGTGLSWQVVAFEEGTGGREPAARANLEVIARLGEESVRWRGTTSEDGAAEMLLPLPRAEGAWLEVRGTDALLAQGWTTTPPQMDRRAPGPVWMPFARREGAIALDVAVLGQRVAPGFPAALWIRATNARTHAPAAGAEITPESDPSLSPAQKSVRTDSRGWAELIATPVALAISLALRARSADGLNGEWNGGLYVSPGGARLETRLRWSPDEEPEIDVVAPIPRTTAYVEIDDARGRAWATALPLGSGPMSSGQARAPRLRPGLYWAVASAGPAGAAELGPATSVRPFFVASSDEGALAFGAEVSDCITPRDARELERALSSCLALAPWAPVPRGTALEGFSMHRERDQERRERGLALAVGAIGIAALLETVLLLRAAAIARARLLDERDPEGGDREPELRRGGRLVVALLVALLGFALLAAFLMRLA